MWVSLRSVAPFLSLSALLACSGGKGTDSGDDDGSGPISARIDGRAWSSDAQFAQCNAMTTPGSLMIQGSRASGSEGTALVLMIYNIGGPGTYPMGVGTSIHGRIASMSVTGSGGKTETWVSPMSGFDGEITFTKVGADRVAGTFELTLKPSAGATGSDRSITEGRFDLPLKGSLLPVPDNAGNSITAKLNGAPFRAVAVTSLTASHLGGPGLQFGATGLNTSISMTLMGVTGPGSYSLQNSGPVRILAVVAGTSMWGPIGTTQDEGTVVVTSLTASRAKGTFSATLNPQTGSAATGPMVITEGVFDIGLP